jgi:hypothetical protein
MRPGEEVGVGKIAMCEDSENERETKKRASVGSRVCVHMCKRRSPYLEGHPDLHPSSLRSETEPGSVGVSGGYCNCVPCNLILV